MNGVWARLRRDGGSITPLMPGIFLLLFMLGGLVVDGSRYLNARAEAQAFAEEAARAGATQIDYQQATLTLNEQKAAQKVQQYCDSVAQFNDSESVKCHIANPAFTDATTCDPSGRQVQSQIVVNVVAQVSIKTTLLSIAGLHGLSTTVEGHARPYQGVTADSAC